MHPYYHQQLFHAVRVAYGRQPVAKTRSQPLVSESYCIDFAFLGHNTLVRAPGQATYARPIPPGTGGMHGVVPLEYVQTDGPSEFIEFTPSLELRASAAAQFRAPDAVYFDEIQDVDDPLLWAVSTRFRAHALGGWPMDELEAEVLMRSLIGHLVCDRLGGQRPRINDSRFSARALSELRDYVESNIQTLISVRQLAQIVHRSPYHFMRTFTHTTGLKPHEFVRAIRMERAKEQLRAGATVKAAAIAVGYAPGHSFRGAFQRYFGVSPSQLVAVFGRSPQ